MISHIFKTMIKRWIGGGLVGTNNVWGRIIGFQQLYHDFEGCRFNWKIWSFTHKTAKIGPKSENSWFCPLLKTPIMYEWISKIHQICNIIGKHVAHSLELSWCFRSERVTARSQPLWQATWCCGERGPSRCSLEWDGMWHGVEYVLSKSCQLQSGAIVRSRVLRFPG